MGDRGQIKMANNGVCLYTHWRGTEIQKTLQAALIRGKERWDDEEYLTRIIFEEMIKDDKMELTGYGISSTIHGDIEHPIPLVDVDAQTITILDEDGKEELESYTFLEFTEKDIKE